MTKTSDSCTEVLIYVAVVSYAVGWVTVRASGP